MMENAYGVTGGGPVLALFAHPDDTEFVCGGALALWSEAGRQLVYAFCTDGSKGSADPTMTGERLVAQRQEEQRAAARHLGCNEVVFLPYPDAMLEPTLALRRDFTRIIRQCKPEIVVCFDPEVFYFEDWYIQHPDHRASGEAALAAVFPSARDRLTFPELLAEGLEPHNVEEVYLASTNKPNCWIDIGGVLDRKIAAMQMHASQVGDGELVATMLRIRAEDAGRPRGIAFAESYHRIDMRPERRFKRSEPAA
jgi:LmbE family N-acetylglucosaminyl deacetylase